MSNYKRKSKRIWLDQYEKGVPADIDPDAYQSLPEMLEISIKKFTDLPAVEYGGLVLCYGELGRYIWDFAAYLQHGLGLKKGDRIALIMPNSIQYLVAACGALYAGLTLVNVNPRYTLRETEYLVNDCVPRAIVLIDDTLEMLNHLTLKTPIEFVIATGTDDFAYIMAGSVKSMPKNTTFRIDFFCNAILCGRQHPCADVTLVNSDVAFIQYTGGTTGLPKGVMLSHRNIVTSLQESISWFAGRLNEGKEIFITPLPLYHVFGLISCSLCCMMLGGSNLLISNTTNMPGFIKELSGVKFTYFAGVASLYKKLLATPGFDQLDFSALKICVCGGMPTPSALLENWKEVTGAFLFEGYALTECGAGLCQSPFNKYTPGSVGVPKPSTYVELWDDTDAPVSIGHPGEVVVKGPQIMLGYWNNPEETAKVMTADGYLRTGDLAVMDSKGFIRIVGRKKDMIIVSGFNVFPIEVENVVHMHPAVNDVVCIGVPDEFCGERAKIFVVKNDPALTAEDLITHCRQYLTDYKVPKQVEFRDSIPRSGAGKIKRQNLLE